MYRVEDMLAAVVAARKVANHPESEHTADLLALTRRLIAESDRAQLTAFYESNRCKFPIWNGAGYLSPYAQVSHWLLLGAVTSIPGWSGKVSK